MSDGKTMRELRAIIEDDRKRFGKLAEAWDALTYEYQDRLLAHANELVAEVDALDAAAAVPE